MNLFNSAMKKLASTNDSFYTILANNSNLQEDIQNIKGLIYTQTDITTINSKINDLEKLLRLYSTNQLVSSDSIEVNKIPGSPPTIVLSNIDSVYERIDNYNSTELYNNQGIIPINLSVPKNKPLLINFKNNDEVNLELEDNLTFILDKDLYNTQYVEFNITPSDLSSENKKLFHIKLILKIIFQDDSI